jgi:DNA-binding transcriptional MerR regulator
MMPNLRVGDLAERTGIKVSAIRYYEEIGLIPAAARQSGGQRVYNDYDVKRLTFVRRCREFGFSIEQVKSLVTLVGDPQRSCIEALDLARNHLAAVRVKLKEQKELERNIVGFIASCDASCAGGSGPDCVALDDLGNARASSLR